MADIASSPAAGEQAKTPKQDTRDQMVGKLQELREKVYPTLEGDDTDPRIVERVNQILNDVMAAIPPDPRPDPVYQRATLSSTMGKLRAQIESALDSIDTKKENTDKIKQPFVDAHEEAKKTDEEKQVPPPAGPSQSPTELQSQVVQPLGTTSTSEPGPTEPDAGTTGSTGPAETQP